MPRPTWGPPSAFTSAFTSALAPALAACVMMAAGAGLAQAASTPPSSASSASSSSPPSNPRTAFEVLDSRSLPPDVVGEHQARELSGLAWDADEQLLYAVSDRGILFHFRLEVSNGRVATLEPLHSVALHDSRTPQRRFNAEGLAAIDADNGIKGDTRLVVALENGPAVIRVTPAGEVEADVPLPPELQDKKDYRSKNKRLEAVAHHARHGVVTAPEAPLAAEPQARHTLYGGQGGRWSFPAWKDDSDLKAIDVLPDGNFLVLERTGPGRARQVALSAIASTPCPDGAGCEDSRLIGGTRDALAEGNFEGMTPLGDDLVLMVSDDGTKHEVSARFTLVGRVGRHETAGQ